MKRFKSRKYEKDCRICKSPLAIARAVTKDVLESEKLHSHEKACEYYIFLKGKAKLEVEGKIVTAVADDVILIEPGEKHKIKKVAKEIDYITIRTSPESKKTVYLQEA